MGCATSTAAQKDVGRPDDTLSPPSRPSALVPASENGITKTGSAKEDVNTMIATKAEKLQKGIGISAGTSVTETVALAGARLGVAAELARARTLEARLDLCLQQLASQQPANAKPEVATARRNSAADIGPDGRLTEEQVLARQLGDTEVQTFRMDDLGVSIRYACLSQRGLYPNDLFKANQDRFLVVPKIVSDHSMLLGVFDGHGPDGDHCANYARKALAPEIQRLFLSSGRRASVGWTRDHGHVMRVSEGLASLHRYSSTGDRRASMASRASRCSQAEGDGLLCAYEEAFLSINRSMHDQEGFDDDWSGTTAITVLFEGKTMHVANVGDSRAVLAKYRDGKLMPMALSNDQTPWRKDERDRIRSYGADVMTDTMRKAGIKHDADISARWNKDLGEELDDSGGHPPRVYLPESAGGGGGCAYTRSLGDMAMERWGITAEAEVISHTLRSDDQFVVIASDGVWEFMTNQTVIDAVAAASDPLDACRDVVGQAYRLWLQFDTRTDDITVVLAYFDNLRPTNKDADTTDDEGEDSQSDVDDVSFKQSDAEDESFKSAVSIMATDHELVRPTVVNLADIKGITMVSGDTEQAVGFQAERKRRPVRERAATQPVKGGQQQLLLRARADTQAKSIPAEPDWKSAARAAREARPRKSLVDHGDEQASPPQATEHVVSTSKMPASTSASLQPETSTVLDA